MLGPKKLSRLIIVVLALQRRSRRVRRSHACISVTPHLGAMFPTGRHNKAYAHVKHITQPNHPWSLGFSAMFPCQSGMWPLHVSLLSICPPLVPAQPRQTVKARLLDSPCISTSTTSLCSLRSCAPAFPAKEENRLALVSGAQLPCLELGLCIIAFLAWCLALRQQDKSF